MGYKYCANCSSLLTCDPPEEGCWCMSLPNIAPVATIGGNDCLCRNCLIEQINLTLSAYYQSHSLDELLAFAKEHNQVSSYIEGLDYQVVDGQPQHSKWYLLKQGKCCEQDCHHCPYK